MPGSLDFHRKTGNIVELNIVINRDSAPYNLL